MFNLTKKEYNTYLLLNLINNYGAVSRTRLGEITELRAATISDITKELLEKGLIKTEGSTSSGRGRNQILLKLNDDNLCAIGVSIEASYITFIVCTPQGNILKNVVKSIAAFSKVDMIVNLITDVLSGLVKEFGSRRFLGIGVGDPGVLDIKGELSIFSSQLKFWSNVPLKSLIEKALNLPVRLEVNERLKALGERKYGLAKNMDDFICVQLGQGIGISIVSNGVLLRGSNGTAGEMGHTHVEGNTSICVCGSFGCLETLASLGSIIAQVKNAISNGVISSIREWQSESGSIGFEEVKKAVSANDKLCMNIVENAGNCIGMALSNVINLINPKLVIFQGPMCEFGSALLNPIKTAVYRNSLSLATSGLEFKVSELMDLSAPLGAITMVVDDFLMAEHFGKVLTQIENTGNELH